MFARNAAQVRLKTPRDIADLCDAALRAWNGLPGNARNAKFKWRGRAYVARHTTFRLLVDTPDGMPVACRYE